MFGPKNLRTHLLPLKTTLGIAVTHEDYAHGVEWGGHFISGKFLTWSQVDALNGWSRRFEAARAVKMRYFREGMKQRILGEEEGFTRLWIRKVCCGQAYWWCGWELNDYSRFRRLEDLLCSMPSYRSGSVSQAIQVISTTRGSTRGCDSRRS